MTTRPAVLLVDNDAAFRGQMKWALASDYDLMEASDRVAALSQIRRAMPPLVLLDLRPSPNGAGASEGLAILREIVHLNPTVKVIAVADSGDRASAIAAIEWGGNAVM